ncbi:MAG: beta-galactosidase [bacterium]
MTSKNVRYDSRSFIVDDKRVMLISGEMHYARSPQELWPALLDRSVACGVNCIASYIFWNFHEPKRDVYDFSGDRDLGYFLQLCEERGLHVILRAGPYCCAEWNFGGYPPYLIDEPGITIRTYNQPYLDRVEKYFEKLTAVIRPHLVTNGGSVILVQVENEYANVAKRYGDDGQRYLAWMADLAVKLGMDVPIIMCEGGTEAAVDTVNGFSISDQRLAEFRHEHPEMPITWTEFWPAWYDTWGFQRHYRDPRNMARHLLRFIARGGSGWNYYMWHGGTNFDRNSMYLQTTDYGFDAPIDEFGRISLKGAYLSRLHHILADNQQVILTGECNTVKHDDGSEEIIWQLDGKKLTLRIHGKSYILTVDGKVKFDAECDYMAVKDNYSSPAWSTLEPLQNWLCHPEPFPQNRADAITAEQPVEQLLLTHDDSDYCWYSTNISVDADGPVKLLIPYGGDQFYIYIDGKLAASSQPPFIENRGSTMPGGSGPVANDLETLMRDGFRHEFTFDSTAGSHRMDILACALGLIKGDWQIAGPMNTEKKGIWQPVSINGKEISDWEMRPFLHGEKVCVADWQPVSDSTKPCTWYRTDFDLSLEMLASDADFRIDMTGMGKGKLFVNGHALGRHWLIIGDGYGPDGTWLDRELEGIYLGPENEPTQRYYHIPKCWLKENNRIVIFEEQEYTPKEVIIQSRTY